MKCILAAVDLTPDSKLVPAAAGALAKTMDARVRLVHVVVPPVPFAPMPGMIPAAGLDPVPGLVERARERLAVMEQELEPGRSDGSAVEVGQKEGVGVRGILRSGNTWLELRSAIDELAPDLVMMGTHGRQGLSHAFLGSIAEKIVRCSASPVLTVREKTPATKTTFHSTEA